MKVTLRSAYLCLLFCSSGLFAQTWYPDADSDGFGDAASEAEISTDAPFGFSNNNTDCDDANNLVHPGATEIFFNGIDDNCDGQLDEGDHLTAKVISSQCGTTLATISASIYTTCLPQITGYRFQITNTKNQTVQYLERGVHYFALNALASYDYATTYSIRIELQRNGIWLGYYGDSCLVSSPAVLASDGAAQLVPSQCGSTLPSINTLISTTSLPGVKGYRFRITNMTDLESANRVQVIDRPLQWFGLTMLGSYNYGTAYQIEVAVRTTGDYSEFGNPCEIYSPAPPTLISCGQFVQESNSLVTGQSLARAVVYRFELTDMQTYLVTTIDRPLNWFTFNNIPDFIAGASYGVRISVMTTGSFSPFGDACEIVAPGASRFMQSKEVSPESEMVSFPNPFVGEFTLATKNFSANAVVNVYDVTGRLMAKIPLNGESSEIRVGAEYPSGVYIVVLTDGDETRIKRMVKR